MIKHHINWQVFSPFTPGISLDYRLISKVNSEFIHPIVSSFFKWKKIRDYSPIDVDKLVTELEFENEKDFVNNYLYNEIFEDIKREDVGIRVKNPIRYIITFDKSIASKRAPIKYPCAKDVPIHYGTMNLGKHPILFYIWIDIQHLINFIKGYSGKIDLSLSKATSFPQKEVKIRYVNAINEKVRDLKFQLKSGNLGKRESIEIEKQIEYLEQNKTEDFQGNEGNLRINLKWNTTDDLDLHVTIPTGEVISYENKEVISKNSIGMLDVDANSSHPYLTNPQENIYWESIPPNGLYFVKVHLYSHRTEKEIPFQVTIFRNDDINGLGGGEVFSGVINQEKEFIDIARFHFDQKRKITFD